MKNILVAGGTDGIGLAFVKQIKAKNYNKIFVLGRDFTQVRLLQMPNVVELACDITDQQSLGVTVAKIDLPLGQFVNTIGTFYRNPVDKIKPADVAQHFEINTVGNINLTNAVLPKLDNQYAEVLVCSATLALEGRESYALQSATKAAYKY